MVKRIKIHDDHARITIKVTEEEYRTIAKAAEMEYRLTNQFARRVVVEEAKRIVEAHGATSGEAPTT